jgi:outer membrane protein assembly factor BamB
MFSPVYETSDGIPEKRTARISLRDDTIKCTDWRTNTIYCYTLTGQQIWTFKDENVLRVPRGIALDKNKNVYVAGRESKNVVVLSPDGKTRRTFSSLKVQICCPVNV